MKIKRKERKKERKKIKQKERKKERKKITVICFARVNIRTELHQIPPFVCGFTNLLFC
jgi:hypothetical protein